MGYSNEAFPSRQSWIIKILVVEILRTVVGDRMNKRSEQQDCEHWKWEQNHDYSLYPSKALLLTYSVPFYWCWSTIVNTSWAETLRKWWGILKFCHLLEISMIDDFF